MNVLNRFVVVAGLLISSLVLAEMPPRLPQNLTCLDSNRAPMAYNNAEVMNWKYNTKNKFQERALVKGVVTDIYPTKTNSKGMTHSHFAIDLDGRAGGDIEIIYNDEFGQLPRITVGMTVIACGDYITANAKSPMPSPNGGIIHWIHYNPGNRDGGKHQHGFVLINNGVYGTTAPAGESPFKNPFGNY